MHFPGQCSEKRDNGRDYIENDDVLQSRSSRKTRYYGQLFGTRKTRERLPHYTGSSRESSEDEPDSPQPSRSSSNSRSDLDLWENSQEEFNEDVFNKYLLKMINLAREFAIFCFVLVAYAAITNDPPKVSKEPSAYPFFPKDTPVKDWYRGEISKAVEKAHLSDMTLVMFYAPWDAQSLEARAHFEVAASYLKDEVHFAAVNCWQPFSECRSQYNKVYRWPVFIAYPSHGRGVQYTGPISGAHLINFVQNVIKPLKRIPNGEQPLDFREAFLVAELNCFPGSPEYGVYYVSALRYLEKDPLRPVTFYVKPSRKSKLKLSLYLWRQVRIKEFISVVDFTVENILKWVIKETEEPVAWVVPTGVKSLSLSERMKSGPSLVLMTPNNPLRDQIDYYDMLEEVAYEYKNCDEWGLNFDMSSKRKSNLEKFKHLKKTCETQRAMEKNNVKIVSVARSAVWANISNLDNKIIAKDKIKISDCNVPYKNKIADMCQNYKIDRLGAGFQSDDLYEVVCENVKRNFVEPYKTSMLRAVDPYSMDKLAKALETQKCRQFVAAEKLFPSLFEPKKEDSKNDGANNNEVQGLACKTNKSLNFLAMDSLLSYHFAEKLGVDLSLESDKSSVFIIDDKLESHHILKKPITVKNLKKFILNYTQNRLERSMKSITSLETKNTHFYSVDQDRTKFNDSRIIYIHEILARNFLETVLQKNKAVLVFYYSKQCAYCSGVSYMFLTLSRKLGLVENLKFTRIDGELNILPWEYTMDTFPTILFFPANKKSETRVYPPDLPITVSNLLGFLLTNLDPHLRIQAVYSLCLQSQFREEKTHCLIKLRNETLSLIDSTLKLWRKSNTRQKRVILHNLNQLRNLQLLFGHTSNNVELIQNTFKNIRFSEVVQDYTARNQTLNRIRDEL